MGASDSVRTSTHRQSCMFKQNIFIFVVRHSSSERIVVVYHHNIITIFLGKRRVGRSVKLTVIFQDRQFKALLDDKTKQQMAMSRKITLDAFSDSLLLRCALLIRACLILSHFILRLSLWMTCRNLLDDGKIRSLSRHDQSCHVVRQLIQIIIIIRYYDRFQYMNQVCTCTISQILIRPIC